MCQGDRKGYRKKRARSVKIEMDSTLDSAYIGSMVDEWLLYLQKEMDETTRLINENNIFFAPFQAITPPIVGTIYGICDHLKLENYAKYLAIHIYDKFCYKYFWEMFQTHFKKSPTLKAWKEVVDKFSNEAKLRLMTCIQIASKMDLSSKRLRISQILHILENLDKDRQYHRNTISQSELKILKTIDFKIPLTTPLQCIEILLVASDLQNQSNIMEAAIQLLNLVYIQHKELYTKFESLSRGKSMTQSSTPTIEETETLRVESNILFLAAAVIVCSTYLICFDQEGSTETVCKLSSLVNVKATDIHILATALFQLAVNN